RPVEDVLGERGDVTAFADPGSAFLPLPYSNQIAARLFRSEEKLDRGAGVVVDPPVDATERADVVTPGRQRLPDGRVMNGDQHCRTDESDAADRTPGGGRSTLLMPDTDPAGVPFERLELPEGDDVRQALVHVDAGLLLPFEDVS